MTEGSRPSSSSFPCRGFKQTSSLSSQGEENGRLEFGGFGDPGTKVGVYRYEDLSGGLASPSSILAINSFEAHVDSIPNDTFQVDCEIHFRWEPDGWWSINNPLGADPLPAGEHNSTFFQPIIIPNQPFIVRWPRLVGQLGGLFKMYSSCHSYRQNLLGQIFLSLLLRL